MTTIHFTDLRKVTDIQSLPTGFWSGLVVFGCLWLLPVVTLIALAKT
jgi:hypothetical protein